MHNHDDDGTEDATARQVRLVRWRMICAVHATAGEKRTALYEWHRDWVHKLQAVHPGWPLNEILEMLLLTEGSASEVDDQLAKWKAQCNGLLPVTGGKRDYQQFLSILHARHQKRISQGLREESREDVARRNIKDGNNWLQRLGKNPPAPKR